MIACRKMSYRAAACICGERNKGGCHAVGQVDRLAKLQLNSATLFCVDFLPRRLMHERKSARFLPCKARALQR